MANLRPIFVGGCPRSGTTLLGSMLGAHPSCVVVPESQFILELLPDLHRDGGFDVDVVARRLTDHFRFKTWGEAIAVPSPDEATGIGSYPELIEWFVGRYAARTGRGEPSLWIEHSPRNAKFVNTLFELFPESKFVHIVRDGRAVASSVMKLPWGPNHPEPSAKWWAHRICYGLAAELAWGPERVMRISYEDLIRRPDRTLQGLCEFAGLDFQPSMIGGDGLRVPEFTTDWHSLVGTKPDESRLNAWEQELTPRQIEIFERVTGDLLRYLSYTPRFGSQAREVKDREKLLALLSENLFWKPWNRARMVLRKRRVERQGSS